MMRILNGCERSGRVREEFRKRGFYAVSVDLAPSEIENDTHHIQGDLLAHLTMGSCTFGYWRLGIFHPPCTYLTSSGLHWNLRVPGRAQKTTESLAFVEKLMRAPIESIAIENPRGCITTRLKHVIEELGFVRQSIQPYEFGDDASKETILLLKNLPPLAKDPAKRVPGRKVVWNGKTVERWSNQCDSGQNRLGPSEDRWMKRSRTYAGIAEAMAEQWGHYIRVCG